MTSLHVLMQESRFPKKCHLMDSKINLLANATGCGNKDWGEQRDCELLDTSSNYHKLYKLMPECTEDADEPDKVKGWPYCACGINPFTSDEDAHLACGPMADSAKAYEFMTDLFHEVNFVGLIYDTFNSHPILTWMMSFVLFLAVLFGRNRVSVLNSMAHDRDMMWEGKVSTLRNDLRRQTRLVQKLKMSEELHSASAEGEGAVK